MIPTGMTLDELRRKRANDMRMVIERQRAPVSRELTRFHDALDGEHLSGCAARELEWLRPVVALSPKPPVRAAQAPHSTHGVASPFVPSMLVVIYTARYFLSGTDVYTVYGGLQAVVLPTARGFEI